MVNVKSTEQTITVSVATPTSHQQFLGSGTLENLRVVRWEGLWETPSLVPVLQGRLAHADIGPLT